MFLLPFAGISLRAYPPPLGLELVAKDKPIEFSYIEEWNLLDHGTQSNLQTVNGLPSGR